MAETSSSLQDALFRIEPTRGLVEYALAVKPYHTKILDILVEYVYEENINVTTQERWRWQIRLSTPGTALEYACGYGHVWDLLISQDSNPVTLITDITPGSYDILGTVATNGVTPGYFIVAGDATQTIPAGTLLTVVNSPYSGSLFTTPNFTTTFTVDSSGPTYVGGRTLIPVTEELLPLIPADTPSTGVLYINATTNTKANSFLVTSQPAIPFAFAVIDSQTNLFAISDTFSITGVVPATKTWIIAGDHTSVIAPTDVIYVSGSVGSLDRQYTVLSSAFISGNTEVVVNETIPLTTTASGDMHVPIPPLDDFNIISVVPVDKKWVISGNNFNGLLSGQQITVSSNTGGGDGVYVIDTITEVGNTTEIVVTGIISPTATNDGIVTVGRLPGWISGLEVKVNSTGVLPSPLNNTSVYHFIPMTTPGVFKLSTIRYPQHLTDYIDIQTIGSGELTITRDELYYPGADIIVQGTYNNSNDGRYTVARSVTEGGSTRVYVLQNVPRPHGGSNPVAGFITVFGLGYDDPSYCPVAVDSGLHSDTFIHERIEFVINNMPHNTIEGSVVDDPQTGFGVDPYAEEFIGVYGTGTNFDYIDQRFTTTSGLPPGDGTNTLLPTGFDTQLWDIGVMGEDLQTIARLYGTTFS